MTDRRTAIITGAGKGVGAGIARSLCSAGIRVCLNYNQSESMARNTLEKILAEGGEAFLYKADVADRMQVRAMAAETVRRYGGIDILVNNAAMQPNRFIDEYDSKTFSWLWEINIGGYWRTIQECLACLRQSECPRIINISSVHGKRPSVFDPGYAMTKAAIRMLTREAALELARDGITVNSVDLGCCKIESKTGEYKYRAFFKPQEHPNPQHRLGDLVLPADAGSLVLYLASPEAHHITGAGIRLDGGSVLV